MDSQSGSCSQYFALNSDWNIPCALVVPYKILLYHKDKKKKKICTMQDRGIIGYVDWMDLQGIYSAYILWHKLQCNINWIVTCLCLSDSTIHTEHASKNEKCSEASRTRAVSELHCVVRTRKLLKYFTVMKYLLQYLLQSCHLYSLCSNSQKHLRMEYKLSSIVQQSRQRTVTVLCSYEMRVENLQCKSLLFLKCGQLMLPAL